MAQTKVKLISDGVIDVNHLASGHSITTDNIGEGSNLYYTDARVSTYLSTNNYATEGYVTTAVANLVDSAPTTLDTLNELAAALGDDPNFATTVTNSIATKLPLAGGSITGTLGIGTASILSGNKLDVRGGNIMVGGYGTGVDYGLIFTPADSSSYWHIYNDTSGALAFGRHATIGSSEHLRIDSAGNIGIGTATPNGTYGKLTVNGSISLLDDQNTKLEIGRYSSGAPNSYIKLGANSNSLRITNNTDTADLLYIENGGNVELRTVNAQLRFQNSVGPAPFIANAGSGDQDLYVSTGGSESMRINNGGQVKITRNNSSTAAGDAHLILENVSGSQSMLDFTFQDIRKASIRSDINGNLVLNSNARNFYFNNDFPAAGDVYLINRDTTFLTAKSNGNVGIGTTSPSNRLHVVDTNPQIRVSYNSPTDSRYAELSWFGLIGNASDTANNSFNIGMYGGSSTEGKLHFKTGPSTDNQTRMTIDRSGNVGIGTTSPSTALHVNGFIRASGISTDNSTKSYAWRLDNTGNSGTTWYRIARYTAGQSSRIKIILTGQPGYSNNSSYGGTATIVAQYNNANNLQGSFWQEGRNKSIYGVNFEQISGTDYYINIQLGSYSEYAIEAIISDGTLTPDVQSSTAGISANVDDTKRVISKAIFANEAVAIGTTNYAPGLNNNLTVGGIKAQTANAGGQFSGGYTTVYTLTNMTNSYIGGRIKAYAHENGNVNTSYVEYYLLRSSSGWTINQIGTRVQAGNGHGHITLQISGNALQMKNDLNSSIGYGYVTLDLFTIS